MWDGSIDERFASAERHYNSIIENTAKLCHELNKKDMFSVFVIFNYLLWNGFFSEDKKYSHSREKMKYVPGNIGMSIMTNYGVCMNNARMFRDFFRKFPYNPSIVEGYLPSNVNFDYDPNITTKTSDRKISVSNHIKSNCAKFLTRKANHDCVLGKDENNAYIFDPTNHCVFYLENQRMAKVLSGSGYFKLIINSKTPWYLKEDIERALAMTTQKNINMNELFRDNVDLCNSNRIVLNDFFDENFNSIKLVSEYVKSLK